MSAIQYVDFKKNVAGQKVKGRGIPIGNHLIVSYAFGSENTYQIYKAHDGKLFISTIFTNCEDCVEIARWFADSYDEYMDIWQSYPDADIIALTKWSVHNGIKIYEMVEEMKRKQRVNKSILSQCWDIAQQNVKGWMRI
jgi:hypothetical protein